MSDLKWSTSDRGHFRHPFIPGAGTEDAGTSRAGSAEDNNAEAGHQPRHLLQVPASRALKHAQSLPVTVKGTRLSTNADCIEPQAAERGLAADSELVSAATSGLSGESRA